MAVKMSSEKQLSLRRLFQNSLWALTNLLLDSVNFLDDDIHKEVCLFLQKPGTRKGVILPRGHLKSSICSFVYPIWLSIRDVNERVLISSNSFTNSKKFIRQIKGAWEGNELLRALFPELVPNPEKARWSDESACLNRPREYQESTYEAAGVGTAVVSRHYTTIVEDDTIAPKKDKLTASEILPSQEDIEKAIGWHKLATPLLVSPRTSRIIVPTTRWTYYDLINHIKTNEPDYDILDIPARLPSGRVIHPKRFDEQVLKSLEQSLGRYFYGALYMNNPVPEEKMIFRPSWFRFFEDDVEYETTRLIVDPAIGESASSCFTAIMLVGFPKNGAIHVDWYKQGHWQEHETAREIVEAIKKFHPTSVGIESVLFQKLFKPIIEARMEAERVDYCPIDELDPKQKDKDLRIRSVQPLMEYGRIFMREPATELVLQLAQFPFGKFKDLLDCLAYSTEYTHPDWIPSPVITRKQYVVKHEDGRVEFDADSILNELFSKRGGGLPFDYQLSRRN